MVERFDFLVMRACFAILALGLLVGASARSLHAQDGTTRDDYQHKLDSLLALVDVEIGQARAADSTAFHLIRVRHRRDAFRVYSEADGDPTELHRLVAEYDSLDRERRRRFPSGFAGLGIAPEPTWKSGHCFGRDVRGRAFRRLFGRNFRKSDD